MPLPTATATRATPSTEEVAQLDALTTALRTRDVEVVRPFVGFRAIACAATPELGGAPPCGPGEETGDQVEAFYLATCEGSYLRPAAVQQALDLLVQMDVYAVYRLPGLARSPGDYSVVLVDRRPDQPPNGWEAIVDDGEIVALLFSCALPPDELVELREYTDAVLAPD
jgi:hypothetical protein